MHVPELDARWRLAEPEGQNVCDAVFLCIKSGPFGVPGVTEATGSDPRSSLDPGGGWQPPRFCASFSPVLPVAACRSSRSAGS